MSSEWNEKEIFKSWSLYQVHLSLKVISKAQQNNHYTFCPAKNFFCSCLVCGFQAESPMSYLPDVVKISFAKSTRAICNVHCLLEKLILAGDSGNCLKISDANCWKIYSIFVLPVHSLSVWLLNKWSKKYCKAFRSWFVHWLLWRKPHSCSRHAGDNAAHPLIALFSIAHQMVF